MQGWDVFLLLMGQWNFLLSKNNYSMIMRTKTCLLVQSLSDLYITCALIMVWVGILLKIIWTTLTKVIFRIRVVWAHFCNILNVTVKVVFGMGAIWNNWRKKIFTFTKWNVWSRGGLGSFFQDSNNTRKDKCLLWGCFGLVKRKFEQQKQGKIFG